MKFKVTDEMRKKIWMEVIVISIAIAIFFAFFNFNVIARTFHTIITLVTPFILGFAIAFLLNKPMIFLETKVLVRLPHRHRHNFAAILAVLLGIITVLLFLGMLIPQLMQSILSLVRSFPGYVEEFQKFALDFIEQNAINISQFNRYVEENNLLKELTDFVTELLPQMVSYTYQLGSTLLNLLLGIMSGLYMLMDKQRLITYVKKINYAILPNEVATYMHRLAITSSDIFNNFIIGKAIDSLIIGILCYIGSLIFQFPYALLLSVFVGVTNMIPVFGPFIGAIPGIVILFIIHPITAFYFAIFVFVLQQFDGNILGPMILGDKLGLPSIGILFSVCVGGGLFGVVGMFIGVPCFAVIYAAIKEYVNHRLKRKGIDIKEVCATPTFINEEV